MLKKKLAQEMFELTVPAYASNTTKQLSELRSFVMVAATAGEFYVLRPRPNTEVIESLREDGFIVTFVQALSGFESDRIRISWEHLNQDLHKVKA